MTEYEQGFYTCKNIIQTAVTTWIEQQTPELKKLRPISDILMMIESVELKKKGQTK